MFDESKPAKYRSSILNKMNTTEADLRERGGRFALEAEELAAYEELRGLDYLRDGVQHRT